MTEEISARPYVCHCCNTHVSLPQLNSALANQIVTPTHHIEPVYTRGIQLVAEIYAVGKSFEQDPKAVHIHAEIENKRGLLLPGMYVKGRILLDGVETMAVPEEAVVREDDQYFLFMVTEAPEGGSSEWHFEPMEVFPGTQENGWMAIRLLHDQAAKRQFALNNAYYLLSELKKGEGGHGHAH